MKPIINNHTQDLYFMQEAIALAKKGALLGEVPVGAVVVHNDVIIGRGFNQPITKNDPRAHAEMIAIYEAAQVLQNYRLPDTTLYVTLEPCSMCAGLLVHARIKRLVFGTTEPKAGVITSQDDFFKKSFLNHRPAIEGGVLAHECSNLLKDFFKERRLSK